MQHALMAWMEMVKDEILSIETVVQKACHNPALLFKISKRGFIRKGYYADLVLVDTELPYQVSENNILYKCKWSPFEGYSFRSSVLYTWVNGVLVYEKGKLIEGSRGKRLTFDR